MAELSTADAEFLTLSVDRTSDAAAGDAFSVGSLAGPAGLGGSGTWTLSFESTRECAFELHAGYDAESRQLETGERGRRSRGQPGRPLRDSARTGSIRRSGTRAK